MEMLLAFVRAPQKTHFAIPPWLFWTLWLGVFALVVLILYAKSRETKKRREGLEQFGMENGFLFSEKPDDELAAHLAEIHFNVAQLEYSPRYSNVLQGSAGGGDALIADRTVGSGKSKSTTTIVAFNMKTVGPQGSFLRQRVGPVAGGVSSGQIDSGAGVARFFAAG